MGETCAQSGQYFKGTLSRLWACLPHPRKTWKDYYFFKFLSNEESNWDRFYTRIYHSTVPRYWHRFSKWMLLLARGRSACMATDVWNLSFFDYVALNSDLNRLVWAITCQIRILLQRGTSVSVHVTQKWRHTTWKTSWPTRSAFSESLDAVDAVSSSR